LDRSNENMKNWSRENIAWLAGILEGEGYFSFHGDRGSVVGLQMTDADVVKKAYQLAGVGTFRGPYRYGKAINKPIYRWRVAKSVEIYALCVAVYPFMGERRRTKIEKLIRLFSINPPTLWKIHGSMQSYARGCRCNKCKAARSDQWRRYRADLKTRTNELRVRST
jgi:hypothetical protein